MCALRIPDGSTEPVSPLETDHGEMCVSLSNFQHLSSNLRFSLSPLASALTRFAPASPLDSALTKNIPGGGGAPCHSLLSTLTLDFQLLPLTRLTSTLTKNVSATPLTSTLTKTKDLKSFIINTYKKPRRVA